MRGKSWLAAGGVSLVPAVCFTDSRKGPGKLGELHRRQLEVRMS